MHLAQASPDVFRTTIDASMWAFKHTERNISELGLSILKELLMNIRASQQNTWSLTLSLTVDRWRQVCALTTKVGCAAVDAA